MRLFALALSIMMLLAGCLDSDANSSPLEGSDQDGMNDSSKSSRGGFNIHPVLHVSWEDVESHEIAITPGTTETWFEINLEGSEMPVLLEIRNFTECPSTSVLPVADGPLVTVKGDGAHHELPWGNYEITRCIGEERSFDKSFRILTTHDCFATTWTTSVSGLEIGAGAEIHVQRPVDQEAAAALIAATNAEYGDPCNK